MTDFASAAKRHYSDGCYLKDDNRTPNAGQLYGFAAECGIKALLVACGYPTDHKGDFALKDSFKKHIHLLVETKLFTMLTTFIQGRSGSRYLAQLHSISDFSDWSTDHRYFPENEIPTSSKKWQNAANEVMNMLQNLQIDGRLP